MKKKILYIYRYDALKNILHDDGSLTGPAEFLWGMRDIDRTQYDVRCINAPRLEKRKGIRKAFWIVEFVFGKTTKIGMPLEIYPMFQKELQWADEIVCVNDPISMAILAWRWCGFLRGKKVHCFIMSLQERIKYFRWFRPAVWLVSMLLRQADSLMTLSDFVHGDFIHDYHLDQKKVKTVYFGIDTDFWYPAEETSEDSFLLAIGNDMNRDFATLVDALPDDMELKIITKKKVDIKGKRITLLSQWMTDDDVRVMYHKALAIVVPSTALKNESSGLSCALQTLACRRPLIISDAPPLMEVLKDTEDCLFYKAENSDDLREKIQSLRKNRDLRAHLAHNGYETVIHRYTCKNMSKELELIFKT